MKFLRNAWYAAAWANELSDTFLARTLLNEPVMLFREENGRAAAMVDRCPHRFAPLSRGKMIDGAVECPYHGLRFGADGSCVHNPHGPVPRSARVKTFPLVERYEVIWIWMGDPDLANPASIPDFSAVSDPDNFAIIRDYLHIGVNYQLAVDNLLDLSHVEFLHPMVGNASSSDRATFQHKTEGNTVWALTDWHDEPLTKLWKILWDTSLEVGDRNSYMRWDPPSNMLLDVGFTGSGRPRSEGATQFSAHLLTPETERSTHYFWSVARNVSLNKPELDEKIRASINHAFSQEDEPMIAACQDRMGGTLDLMSLKPVMLKTDGAAGTARKILDQMIRDEHSVPDAS